MTTFSLGIDLGTSRTSIATSTGKRLTHKTVVGYPKDIIASKRFKGRTYLLGDEAIDNRLALKMVWPLGAGIINADKDSINAVSLILKNIIAEAIPDKKEGDKIHAAIGVPALASTESKALILKATKGFIDKVLVVSEPFAVAYNLEMFDEGLIVDIGAGSADICLLKGTLPQPEDQATFETAGNYLTKRLMELILDKYPEVQITDKIVNDIKEKYGYVSDSSDPIMVTLTASGKPKDFDVTSLMQTACREVTDTLSEAIQKKISEFDPEFQHKVRNNIVVAGGGSRLVGINRSFEKSLEEYGGATVKCVTDSEHCGSEGCLKISLEFPAEMWDTF